MSIILKKLFGTAQSRKLKKYRKIVLKVNFFDGEYKKLTDEQLKEKTAEFKLRYNKGESLDALLPEAYAAVKNICRRLLGEEIHVSGYDQKWDMVPYDVQILGAIAMHFGAIAEMQTGEGKTLTASMALYLNALTSNPVHLVTVNDYLAKRDCEWMGKIFEKLDIKVAALTNDIPLPMRKDIYLADIVYGTASEFGFDYLRDNSMAINKNEKVQRPFYFFAIVDEIDSILIDEARTPLIISGPAKESYQMYSELKDNTSALVRLQRDFCSKLASNSRKTLDSLNFLKDEKPKLSKEEELQKDEAFKKLWVLSKGTPRNNILKKIKEDPELREEIDKWETYFFSEQNKKEKSELLSQLYIIVDERASEYELTDKGIKEWQEDSDFDFVMLDLGYEYSKIDEDKSLSEKQRIEKKTKLREEDSKRKERAHNLSQLFRAHLLMERDVDYIISDNKIVIIDENTGRPQPGRRFSDGLHQAIEAKENVPIQRETQTYATTTLQNYFRMYEKLSGMTGTAITEAKEFKEIYKLDVLEIPTYTPCIREDFDDKIYMTEREKYAAIVKEIKKLYLIGRPILIGTESVEISEKLSRILKQNKLPHNVLNAKNNKREAEIIAEAGRKGAITLSTNMAGRGTDIKLTAEVKELGGLYVIGANRHHSRRIDRQLRGRSGRLGDPGSSQFFVSFEDSLLRLFSSPRLTIMLKRFRPPEGEPISAKVLNKSIETAQKRIEQRNFNIRKYTLEYDDVINKQRKEIYSFRNEVLYSEDCFVIAEDILKDSSLVIYEKYFIDNFNIQKKFSDYLEELRSYFPITFGEKFSENVKKKVYDKILKTFYDKINYQMSSIQTIDQDVEDSEEAKNILNEIVRNILIMNIDEMWQKHLLSIDHLRSDVQLRSVGQKDPLLEFKHEAFRLFDILSQTLKLKISKNLFLFELLPKNEEVKVNRQKPYQSEKVEDNSFPQKKIKRNDPCTCGSGKKYKKCCGASSI
ncbi:MAG: preprotein translocase subunit SecA [Chlamydiae bacterium SM23_39]|nr:MAG: preprotein translocase subunit SecA [Chlamydiae bacterium SM23_39]